MLHVGLTVYIRLETIGKKVLTIVVFLDILGIVLDAIILDRLAFLGIRFSSCSEPALRLKLDMHRVHVQKSRTI
jgi:hypothetical protein